jgi:hypothetical protein
VVGADIVSSSYVACGDVLFAAVCADGVRGDRFSIEALGVSRVPAFRLAAPGGHYRGPALRGESVGAFAGGLVRRVPHERGDRPGVSGAVPSVC